jgi:hypothetical protein
MNISYLSYNTDTKSFSTTKVIKDKSKSGDIIFIDLDDTIVDHSNLRSKLHSGELDMTQNNCIQTILKISKPYPDSIEIINKLSKKIRYLYINGR